MFQLHNQDCLQALDHLRDSSVDLVIADPPYGLGKDYGNASDQMEPAEFLAWTQRWILKTLPKIKPTGSFYIFATWQYAPEIFSFIKKHMTMVNEIIWDRKVPSMGGTTRKFSSVHDNIGFFAKQAEYYFDLDPVRVPYDPATKKARTRSIFIGKKWLERGYNPKDVWSISRLHRIHRERENHPTQKPLALIERMIQASCPENGLVLDPFAGSGTTLAAAVKNQRRAIGFEVNPDYCRIIEERLERASFQQRLRLGQLESLSGRVEQHCTRTR
ncbi:MAG: site-specific DNA-methyltransferase [Nitrospira sp.]|nr:site-specific DNA-methyltransferase [Nitrospira sp.]